MARTIAAYRVIKERKRERTEYGGGYDDSEWIMLDDNLFTTLNYEDAENFIKNYELKENEKLEIEIYNLLTI